MSKVSHLPKNIPNKNFPFTFKAKGSVSGHAYSGSFVATVPDVRMMGRIGIEFSRLNDGVPVSALDMNTATLHNAIAFLKVVLSESPAWFQNAPDDPQEEGIGYGLDTMDINVPIEIFRKADELIKGWQESLKGQPKSE